MNINEIENEIKSILEEHEEKRLLIRSLTSEKRALRNKVTDLKKKVTVLKNMDLKKFSETFDLSVDDEFEITKRSTYNYFPMDTKLKITLVNEKSFRVQVTYPSRTDYNGRIIRRVDNERFTKERLFRIIMNNTDSDKMAKREIRLSKFLDGSK